MRRLADACTPSNLPAGFDLLASYVDGRCASDRDDPVRISSLATNAGNVGDCEPSNPPPATWVRWVRQRRAAGVDPTIYCADDSLSDFFAGFRHRDVIAAFEAAGEPQPHYWLSKPGATAIPPGAVAVQVALGVDGDRYDVSLVADYWPGVDGDEMTLDPNDPIVQELRTNLARVYWEVVSGFDSDPNAGAPARFGQLKDFPAVVSGVAALQQAVANIPAGGGLTAAQAAQLQQLAADVATIKAQLGKDLA